MANKKRAGMKTRKKIETAAVLRAGGATWNDVAVALGYSSGGSAEVCLQGDHRDDYQAAYEQAVSELLEGKAEETAIRFQLQLIRRAEGVLEGTSKEELDAQGRVECLRVAQQAAHSIQTHVAKLKGQQVSVRMEVEQRIEVEETRILALRDQANALAEAAAVRFLPVGTARGADEPAGEVDEGE